MDKPRAQSHTIIKQFVSPAVLNLVPTEVINGAPVRHLTALDFANNFNGYVPDINGLYLRTLKFGKSLPAVSAVCKTRTFDKASGEVGWFVCFITVEESAELGACDVALRNEWLADRVNMQGEDRELFLRTF